MCEHGLSVPLIVPIPAKLSHSGAARVDVKPVDACIAPIVAALNSAGVLTAGSCCGHGKAPGEILLHDGRRVVIHPAVPS